MTRKIPFTGELMVCIMSGARKRSNPDVESGWDCIEMDGERYYVSKKWREKSYRKCGIGATQAMMLEKAIELHGKRGQAPTLPASFGDFTIEPGWAKQSDVEDVEIDWFKGDLLQQHLDEQDKGFLGILADLNATIQRFYAATVPPEKLDALLKKLKNDVDEIIRQSDELTLFSLKKEPQNQRAILCYLEHGSVEIKIEEYSYDESIPLPGAQRKEVTLNELWAEVKKRRGIQ